jgi:hypothetical protein
LPLWRTPSGITKDQLRAIQAPVAVPDGDHDEIILIEQIEEMAHLIPRGKLMIQDICLLKIMATNLDLFVAIDALLAHGHGDFAWLGSELAAITGRLRRGRVPGGRNHLEAS